MCETKEKLVPDRWAGWCSCRIPNLLHGSINELSSLITLPLGVRSEVMMHWIIAVYFHKAGHSVLKTMFIKTLTSLIWLCSVPVLEKRGGQVRQWQCGRIYVDTLYFIWSAGILSQWPVTRTHTHIYTHCQHHLSAINLSITTQVEPFIHTIQACGYSLNDPPMHTHTKGARGCSTWLGFLMLGHSIVHWNTTEVPYCSEPGIGKKILGNYKVSPCEPHWASFGHPVPMSL